MESSENFVMREIPSLARKDPVGRKVGLVEFLETCIQEYTSKMALNDKKKMIRTKSVRILRELTERLSRSKRKISIKSTIERELALKNKSWFEKAELKEL